MAMPAGQRARVAGWAARRSRVASVPDLLDGQVGLDLECLDRVYLNGYALAGPRPTSWDSTFVGTPTAS